MANSSYLTDTGLTLPTQDDLVSDMVIDAQSLWGSGVQAETYTVLGQLFNIFSAQLYQVYQLGAATYDAQNAYSAQDKNLTDCCARVGVQRLGANKSATKCVLIGNTGVNIPEYSQIAVANTSKIFELTNDQTIGYSNATFLQVLVASHIEGTNYYLNIDNIDYSYTAVANDTADNIASQLAEKINTTSDKLTAENKGSGVFTVQANSTLSTFSTELSAGLSIEKCGIIATVEAMDYGVISAPANSLTEIKTPVYGWDSSTNPNDATLGRDKESDTELLLRRNGSLKILGSGSTDAISAALKQLDGVTNAYTFQNTSNETDANNLPPKSVSAIVLGGNEQEIAQTFFNKKSGGIATYGEIENKVIDSNGDTQLCYFSRPTEMPIYINIIFAKEDKEALPADINNAIISAVIEYGNTLTVNTDVIPQRFVAAIYKAIPEGIEYLDLSMKADVNDSWSKKKITIDRVSIAVFKSANITVSEDDDDHPN
ncbi:baseplate J/gp47 family protein [Piscirickettsia salmonis]|uniref:baseplate J/gp47 family protein n=1 Tax=Piscirickettsia salmonis TaxID=1238 RepID=UPI003EBD5B68